MCGIFGTIALGPNADFGRVDVQRGLRAIRARGPDGSGSVSMSGARLGHVRLAIIDLTPGGAQPMLSSDGKVAVTFNGEIYNHHELRRELAALGATFRSRSDTEVLLEGYRAWGVGVVDRIDGMFAFGVYDERERALLLATDRPGKKPIFWGTAHDLLWFASEPKALFAAGFPSEVDLGSLPSILSFGYVPAPATFHRGLKALPPASVLQVEYGRPISGPRRYFIPPFAAPRVTDSYSEAAKTVRVLMTAAVERRLESDVPLGAFLSGGIDSTIVVGLLARSGARPVRTFSIGFSGDARFDETHFARLVAKRFGTEHTEFTLTPPTPDAIEALVHAHDGPVVDASAAPTSVVSRLTREHVTVALSGDGGDELFAGYPRLIAAEFAETLPVPVRKALFAVARQVPTEGAATRRRLARLLLAVGRPLSARLHGWITTFYDDLGRALRPGSCPAVDDPIHQTERALATYDGAPTLARILGYNYDTYLAGDLLPKVDRCAMANSLEVRSPFLDTKLIEYVARLPAGYLRRGRETKRILKRAFADLLPPEIVRRKKMGFGMPLDTWFRAGLRDYLMEMLEGRERRLTEWIEPRFIASLIDRHQSGASNLGLQLWLLLTLEIWLRRREEWLRSARTG